MVQAYTPQMMSMSISAGIMNLASLSTFVVMPKRSMADTNIRSIIDQMMGCTGSEVKPLKKALGSPPKLPTNMNWQR